MNDTPRKNVIWVFGDQHRRQMAGHAGDSNARTPHIDTLAEYGTRFSRAVSNFPLCCPARGTLLTGLHAHKCIPGHNYRLPEGQTTLAHVFGENGYRTAWFGKWHVDGPLQVQPDGSTKQRKRSAHEQAPASEPFRETHLFKPWEARGGFEAWVGYENNNSPHNTWVHGHDENGDEIDHHRLPGFETDSLTDLLIDYLEKRAAERDQEGDAKPFFAALSVQPPHDPYAAPEPFMGHFNPAQLELRPNVPPVPWVEERARRELAGAYAMVENLDWNLGRIRAALRRLALDTDTYIVFFSDHGDLHGSHGQFHKTNPLEESVGVPFIIGGALDVQGGPIRRIETCPASLVDLAPTTLGLCGIEPPEWMQGCNLAPVHCRKWNAPEPERPDSVFLQEVIPTGHGDSVDRAWRGVITRDGWKYICFERTDWMMFNLEEDPYEQVNLAHNTRYAKKRDELRSRLRRWIAETGDQFAVPE